MSDVIGPVVFTLFVWWFSTGLILFLDRLPRSTFKWSMAAASGIAGAGLLALDHSSRDASVAGAYCAFASALSVWAWHECAFLMGYVTGPVTTACPPGATGWRRFSFAAQSILHHEVGIAVTAVAVVALTASGPNKVGMWTFLVLWIMRISTKINLFLGVRNIGEEFLPEHLRYIATYFARKPMNVFFPFSVTLTTGAMIFLLHDMAAPGASAFDIAAATFVVTLLALALIEHWFLVTPFPITALWSWSLKARSVALLAPTEQPKIVEKPARIARLPNQPHPFGRSS